MPFLCLLAVHVFCVCEMSVQILSHFKHLFVFWDFVVLDTTSLIYVLKICYLSFWLAFSVSHWHLSKNKIFNFDEVQLVKFFYISYFLCSKKLCQLQICKYLLVCFLLEFVVLGFTIRFVIHFRLNFMYDVGFIFSLWLSSWSSTIYWKVLSLLINWPCMYGSPSGHCILFHWSVCLPL